MRYLIIGVVLLSFIGCGSSSTKSNKEIETPSSNTEKPDSPSPQNSEKKPPSIPNI